MKRSEMVKMLLTFATFCLVSNTFGESDEECVTKSEKIKGTCQEPIDCIPILKLFEFGKGAEAWGKHGSCSFNNQGNARICCPIYPEECTAPSVKTGTCQLIEECSELPDLYAELNLPAIRADYIGDCTNERGGNLKICCPVSPENCTALKVPKGTCQIVPDACPELHKPITELSAANFIESYDGGCKTLRNGTSRFCCPVSTTTGPDDLLEICRQPVEVGPCIAFIPNWYYDEAQGRCIGFSYGGCSGNANRFQSVELCERQCGRYHDQGGCPNRYTRIGGHCLYISTGSASYGSAQQKCLQIDGTLGSFQSDDHLVAEYLRRNGLGGPSAWYWVGANDHQSPGTYRWNTGGSFQHPFVRNTPWKEDPGRMCIYYTNRGYGRTPCVDVTYYICEYTGFIVPSSHVRSGRR